MSTKDKWIEDYYNKVVNYRLEIEEDKNLQKKGTNVCISPNRQRYPLVWKPGYFGIRVLPLTAVGIRIVQASRHRMDQFPDANGGKLKETWTFLFWSSRPSGGCRRQILWIRTAFLIPTCQRVVFMKLSGLRLSDAHPLFERGRPWSRRYSPLGPYKVFLHPKEVEGP